MSCERPHKLTASRRQRSRVHRRTGKNTRENKSNRTVLRLDNLWSFAVYPRILLLYLYHIGIRNERGHGRVSYITYLYIPPIYTARLTLTPARSSTRSIYRTAVNNNTAYTVYTRPSRDECVICRPQIMFYYRAITITGRGVCRKVRDIRYIRLWLW